MKSSIVEEQAFTTEDTEESPFLTRMNSRHFGIST